MLRVTRAPKNNSRRILNLIAALVFAVALAGLGLGAAAPASAATRVFGYDTPGVGGGFLGAVRGPDGRLAYCIDPVGVFPSGATDSGTDVSSISARTAANSGGHGGTAAVSGVGIQNLNYSLAKFGESADSDNAAAAEAAYVYSITADYPYPTTNPQANVTYYIHARVPAADRAAVQAGYAAIAAEVDAHYATAAPAGSTTTILMSPHPSLAGTVTVTVSPNASTGTLVLTGAVVAGTTDATVPVHNGQVVDITATALTGPHLYDITATSTFTVPTVPLPVVHLYTTGSPAYAQRDISVGGYVTGTVVSSAYDVDPLAGPFEPVVTTAVETSFVAEGDELTDELIASIDPDSEQTWGTNSSGTYKPVAARGVVYCGLTTSPVLGGTPPTDAIMRGPIFITLNGPGTYTATLPSGCPESGYASWIWSIQATDQSAITALALPTGYRWSDNYGQRNETAFVKAKVVVRSEVSAASVGVHQPVSDSLTVALDPSSPGWPVDSRGVAVPIELTGIAYWVEGNSAPATSTLPPPEAIAIATTSITVSGVGEFTGPTDTPPQADDGFVIWQWSVGGSEYAQTWTEQFAEPTQIATVVAPTISSVADASVVLNHSANDVVRVVGPAMGSPAQLVWAAYFDSADSTPTCDESTLAFDSSSSPVTVTSAGSYALKSPPTFRSPGQYFWVATLFDADGHVIAKGACGDSKEVTNVVAPLATTGIPGLGRETALATLMAGLGATLIAVWRRLAVRARHVNSTRSTERSHQ